MTIEESASGDIGIFRLEGELDMTWAPALRDRLASSAERARPRAIVNLDRLTYVDSAGLGVLVASMKAHAGKGGKLVLAGPTANVRHVLEITRLAQHFSVFETEAEALLALA